MKNLNEQIKQLNETQLEWFCQEKRNFEKRAKRKITEKEELNIVAQIFDNA